MLHLWVSSNSEVCCVIFLCIVIIFHRKVQLANHILPNYTAEINTLIATLASKVALEETKTHVCLWRLWSLTTIITLVNTFYSCSTAGWTNCTSQVLNYDFECLGPLGILWESDQWDERQNKSLSANKFMRGNWKGSSLQCSEASALLGRFFLSLRNIISACYTTTTHSSFRCSLRYNSLDSVHSTARSKSLKMPTSEILALVSLMKAFRVANTSAQAVEIV